MFGGVALWLALGFILWRNCGAVCPDCDHDPMGGNVGWTRESFILHVAGFTCFLIGLWGAFHLALLLIWLFPWLMSGFLWDIGLQLGIAEGWPETTFVYEHGHGSDGDRKFITRYRLTYYGRNDWFEEVLPHGTFPQPRSTRRMEGRVYTEHDLDTGLTETEVIGESTIFSSSGWFFPQPFALHEVNWDGSPRLVETDVKVCSRAREIPGNAAGMACRNNAPAWRFDGRHGHHMLLDDRRGITLGGSAFKMIEVRVEEYQKPVGWSMLRAASEMQENRSSGAALWWFFVVF